MQRSKHNLSHHRLLTFDMGQLVPCGVVEVLPGDTFRHSTSVLLRVGTLVNPLMHPVSLRVHHWFVPARVAFNAKYDTPDAWETFINDSAPTHDTEDMKNLAVTDVTAGTLLNHLGLPVLNSINMDVNFVPLVAYNMIWNQHYRDQELQSELNEATNTTLQRICWEKDYFTTARTHPQFGADTLQIPFAAGQIPISGIGFFGNTAANIQPGPETFRDTGENHEYTDAYVHTGNASTIYVRADEDSDTARPEIYAEMDAATGGIDVNDFRRIMALQRFLEARARFGARYRDYLRYLGIRPRDGRLEEPEYLGGGKQTIAFSEVLATAEGTSTEVGDMAGHGIAALRTRPYTRFFDEHGFVISLISARPKSIYQEGMDRHWLKDTRDDLWQKEYEAMGPQAVNAKEVYAAAANETTTFGYVDRHREYREHPSRVSGFFGSTMDDWHYARSFGSTPTLNTDFVTCTPTDDVYADENAPELMAQVRHSLVARRLVSKEARY